MSDIPQIGRKRRPGEGTIALLRERPEVLDSFARMMWAPTVGLSGGTMDGVAAWALLTETERESWRERAFAESVETSLAWDADNPEPPDGGPDGGGGEPLPISRIA